MTISIRDQIKNRIMVRLAANIVDVELGAEDLEECVLNALDQYRNRSSNSVEEGYFFLEVQEDKNEYILPKEIVEVRQIFRRGVGRTQGGVLFDPFGASVTNFYLIQAGAQGGLLQYYLYTQYQELIGRLFGEHIMFSWHPSKHLIKLVRNPRGAEVVLLWGYYHRSDDELFDDIYAKQWLINYATAYGKLILGMGRGKFTTINGPQGGTSLDGQDLKTQGAQEIQALEKELEDLGYGDTPLGFIIG